MLDLNYIAGLIDADGSINISVSRNRYKRKKDDGRETLQFSFVVNLRQVSQYRWVLEEVQNTLGLGKIYDHASKSSQAMSSWQTTTEEEALEVCKKLRPYLKIKWTYAGDMIEALELWKSERGPRKGAGYIRPDWVKQEILKISTRMNPSQQKASPRRNKEIRQPESLGIQVLHH
jgi:hypothetical protein